MTDSVANVLMNYSRVMPNPAGQMAEGFARGQRNKIAKERTKLEERRTEISEERNTREADADKRAQELQQHKELAGVAASANTPEKWASAQELGFLPKEMSYESREPYIMGVMTQAERMGREKFEFQKGQKGVENVMAERVQTEKERSNRANELAASTKAAKTGTAKTGRGGVSESSYFARETGALLGGDYDAGTDTYTYKDSTARRKAVKIKRDAAREMQGNPSMTREQAFFNAAQRNGIDPTQTADQEELTTQSSNMPTRPSRDYSNLY